MTPTAETSPASVGAENIPASTAQPAAAKGVVCKCRADIEAKLTQRYAEQAPEATGHKVELQGYGFAISGNSLVMCAVMPYQATATYPVKKGGTKAKTLKGSMNFNYCPFCGKSAK